MAAWAAPGKVKVPIACYAGLTEEQAYLVETTLIWQVDGTTLNEASGHFIEKFRHPRIMHLKLPGFKSNRSSCALQSA